MAKQVGPIKIEGRRIGKLVFYKWRGQYCIRTASSLTRKRVKKDPKFRRTMINAGLLGRASKIGSEIYQSLPANWRKFWMYRSFTGEALLMLRGGMMEEEIKNLMMKTYVQVEQHKSEEEIKDNVKEILDDERKTRIKYEITNTRCETKGASLGITNIYKRRPAVRIDFPINSKLPNKEAYYICYQKRRKCKNYSDIAD